MTDPDDYEGTRESIRQIEAKVLARIKEANRRREARIAELRSRDPEDERGDESTEDPLAAEDFTREPAGPGAILSWPEIKILQLRGVGARIEGDLTLQLRDGQTHTLPVDAGIRALMRRPNVPEDKARGANVLVDIPSVAAIAASNADEGQKKEIISRALNLLKRAAPLHGLPHAYRFLQVVLRQRRQAIGIIAEAIASSPLGQNKAYAGLSDESALFETAGAVADTLERIAKHEAIETLVQSASVAPDLASIHIPDHMREDIFSWDAVLADELEKTGQNGKKLAETVRNDARKRTEAMIAGRDGAAFLREWTWPVNSKGTAIPFGLPMLRQISRAIWLDVVEPRRKRESTASPIEIRESLGYTKLPKIAAGASWAFGAEGLTGVELDGDRYGFEPNLAREIAEGRAYVPKSMALLPREYAKRPHQESLALAFDPADEDADPIPVALSNTLIGTIEAKLMLLAMADHNVRSGHLAMASVDEWTTRLFPNANRIQARDRARTVGAFWNVKSTCIYNPAQGNAPSIFDVSPAVRRLRDGEIDPSAEIWIGYAKGFELAIANYFGQGRYAGDFLINLTGAMELDNRHPAQLRYYVRSAATWNASFDPRSGAYRPDMVPTYEIDRWAAMNNALPPSAVDYLNQTPDGRRKLANKRKEASKAREQTRADLEALQAKGLIRLETVDRTKIRILPPEAYSDARNLARKTGLRPERKE